MDCTQHLRMRFISLLLLFFLNLFFAVSAGAEGLLCDSRFEYARTHGRPLKQLPWAKLSQILLIGDEHASSHPGDLIGLASAYRSAHSAGTTCLFLEVHYQWTPEDFLNAIAMGRPTPIRPEFETYFRQLVTLAESKRFPMHFVDHQEISKHAPDFMNQRDEKMAGEIHRVMQSGACQYGVMFVGKEHITPVESGRRLLRDNLRRYGYKTSTMHIVYSDSGDEWAPLCPEQAYRPQTPVYFASRGIKDLPVFFGRPLSAYGFFDDTILSP